MIADLEVLVSGIGVVLAVLVLLWALTVLMGFLYRTATRRPRKPASVPEGAGDEKGVPPHHLVAIVAAVATVLDRPHRIRRIVAPTTGRSGWARDGRVTPWPMGGRR